MTSSSSRQASPRSHPVAESAGLAGPSAPRVQATPLVGLLAGFGRELRAAGLAVGSGDIVAYCTAMAALDPSDLPDLYWAGRTVLVTKRGHPRVRLGVHQ